MPLMFRSRKFAESESLMVSRVEKRANGVFEYASNGAVF